MYVSMRFRMGAEALVSILGSRWEISGRSDWLPPLMAEAGVGLAASHSKAEEDKEALGAKAAYRAKPPRMAAAEDARAIPLPGSFADDAKNSEDALLLLENEDACRTNCRHDRAVDGRRAANRSGRASMMEIYESGSVLQEVRDD